MNNQLLFPKNSYKTRKKRPKILLVNESEMNSFLRTIFGVKARGVSPVDRATRSTISGNNIDIETVKAYKLCWH